MVLKLYGMGLSTCTRRVAAILREKDVPYELVEISLMKGEHKSPAYLEKQPFGQVPYIVRLPFFRNNFLSAQRLYDVMAQDDDGLILFESRAIARYVARKYSSQGTQELLPTDLNAYAAFEQAASIESSNFDPFASGIVAEKVFKPCVSSFALVAPPYTSILSDIEPALTMMGQRI